MNQAQNIPQTYQNPTPTQIQQQKVCFAAKKKQIQNEDGQSHIASISENIERIGQIEAESFGLDSVVKEKLQPILRKVWTCVVGTCMQFSILIGLILIQYISSTATLLSLIVIIFLALALHPPVIVLTLQIQALLQRHHHLDSPPAEEGNLKKEGNKEDSQIPTIPMINQQACKRANAKTKKMQYPNTEIHEQKHTQLTIKKEADHNQQQPDCSSHPQSFKQGFAIKKNLLILVKALQTVMEVTFASLSLFSFAQGSNANHEVVVGLSIIIYILAVASSIMFCLLLKEISCFLRPEPVKFTKKQRQAQKILSERQQAKTKISIDQLIQAKPIERKKTFSIEVGLKAAFHSEEERSEKPQDRQDCKSQVQKQSAIKLDIKRSVLKQSKVYEAKSRKTTQKSVEEEIMERRKVEINSKKIQYFEYAEISPSQSVVDEDVSRGKPGVKSQFNAQRTKYVRQRMQAEARILSSKVMAREAQTRSQGCLSNPSRSPPVEVETRIDHFL